MRVPLIATCLHTNPHKLEQIVCDITHSHISGMPAFMRAWGCMAGMVWHYVTDRVITPSPPGGRTISVQNMFMLYYAAIHASSALAISQALPVRACNDRAGTSD